MREAFDQSKWIALGTMGAEDALEVLKPWVKQADVAKSLLELVRKYAPESVPSTGNAKFNPEDINKVLDILKKIDWKTLSDAMTGDDPKIARAALLEQVRHVAPQSFLVDMFIAFQNNMAHPEDHAAEVNAAREHIMKENVTVEETARRMETGEF